MCLYPERPETVPFKQVQPWCPVSAMAAVAAEHSAGLLALPAAGSVNTPPASYSWAQTDFVFR